MLKFLIAVSRFKDVIEAHGGDTDYKLEFLDCKVIVYKFIVDDSPFEVNIDTDTKSCLLSVEELDTYTNLDKVKRAPLQESSAPCALSWCTS